ncbi:hypothetical protein BV898_19873, partial [Hypsibius exemplaris]
QYRVYPGGNLPKNLSLPDGYYYDEKDFLPQYSNNISRTSAESQRLSLMQKMAKKRGAVSKSFVYQVNHGSTGTWSLESAGRHAISILCTGRSRRCSFSYI